jgi:hypothetical protein
VVNHPTAPSPREPGKIAGGQNPGGHSSIHPTDEPRNGRPPEIAHREEHHDERVRDPAREREDARLHEHDFHDRDFRHFDERERVAWRGGRWRDDWHYGRRGWWYEVGGAWYAYPEPIFPYPLVVAPLIVDYAEGQVAAEQDAGIVVAPLPALPAVAYHCASPEGFFPAVDACGGGWVTIARH